LVETFARSANASINVTGVDVPGSRGNTSSPEGSAADAANMSSPEASAADAVGNASSTGAADKGLSTPANSTSSIGPRAVSHDSALLWGPASVGVVPTTARAGHGKGENATLLTVLLVRPCS